MNEENIIIRSLDKIQNRLDTISDDCSELKIISAKQEENLKEHMRRTEILEQQVVPLTEKSFELKGILKAAGFVVSALGVIGGLVFKYLV